VIESVRNLQGRVICPDDPTILIAAQNEACRNLAAELDAAKLPGVMPAGLYADVAHADWLVRVHAHFDDWFTPEMMEDLGFERVSFKQAGTQFRKIYSLWRRVKPAATQPVEPTRQKRRRPTPAA
jgi:hypothetical protein